MTRAQPTSGEFARLGFNSPETAAKLWQRWAERLGQEPTLELAALSRYAADPDQALEALARVHEQAPDIFGGLTTDPAWRDRAIRVLGASTVLARFFTRHPAELAGLRPAPAPRGAQGWAAFFQERMTAAEPSPDEVRRANYAALSQVAAFDLAAAEPTEVVETVGQELSHIADAVLASALNCARAEVANSDDVRLAVVALGKTGAQELNYLSDVDVVYLAEPAEGVQLDDAMRIGAQVAGALAPTPQRAASGRWTPHCVPKANLGRWFAPWRPAASTTRPGQRTGSSRPCSRRVPSPGTWSWGRPSAT